MKVTKPLKFVYRFLKIHGLIPFHFDFNKRKAFFTNTSLSYSVVFALVLWSYLTYYVYTICALIIRIEQDSLMIFVLLIDMVTAFFKAFCVGIVQLLKRHKIVDLINSFMKLCEQIFGEDFIFSSCFFDLKLRNSFKTKLLSVSVQIISLTIAFFNYDYNLSFYYTVQNAILILWINIITTIVNSVFYCGSMLFIVRFYQILEEKLRMLGQLGAQLGVDSSKKNDDCAIDRIYFLYEQIITFTSKVCDIYVFQIILSLSGVIIWTTASVSRATI